MSVALLKLHSGGQCGRVERSQVLRPDKGSNLGSTTLLLVCLWTTYLTSLSLDFSLPKMQFCLYLQEFL